MSISSAPSPGQAMLTKELKANKERQKRQAIMQNGWKSAVEAMMTFNNDATEDDEGNELLDKVAFPSLDPTGDELIGSAVSIIADEEAVEDPIE